MAWRRDLNARLQGLRSRLFESRRFRRFRSSRSYGAQGPVAGYLGSLGDGNLGDEALFFSFQTLFPELELVHCDVPPPIELSLWAAARSRPLFDFVFLGGGTLIGHDCFLDRLRLHKGRGRRIVVFGTGVSDPEFPERPVGLSATPETWAAELAGCSYVGVRGPRSARLLAAAGLPGVEVVGDPAILLVEPRSSPPPFRARLVVNLGFHDWMRGDEATLLREVGAACQTLLARGWHVEFIPLHWSDVELGVRLRKEPGLSGMPVRPLGTVADLLETLQDFDVVLAQRLHGVVLATAAAVPTLSLGYRPKCADYMESIGALPFCRRTDEVTADELTFLVESLGRDHGGARLRLIESVGHLRVRLREAASRALRIGLGGH